MGLKLGGKFRMTREGAEPNAEFLLMSGWIIRSIELIEIFVNVHPGDDGKEWLQGEEPGRAKFVLVAEYRRRMDIKTMGSAYCKVMF